MPAAAYQPCNYPRCSGYAVAQGYCPIHVKQAKRDREYPKLTPNHRRFRKQRASFILRYPICARCGDAPAAVLDHRIPHRGDARLFWNQSNWQGLCVHCHGIKTANEVWPGRRGDSKTLREKSGEAVPVEFSQEQNQFWKPL